MQLEPHAMFSSFINFLLATASMVPFFSPTVVPSLRFQRGCVNPPARKEWRTLSKYEQAEFIRSVKCLANMPHDPLVIATQNQTQYYPPLNVFGSYYDDISYTHMDLSKLVHFTGLFLPWHRSYVKAFETAIQTHCRYEGMLPYWDWTLDAQDFYNSPIFDSDPQSGLGGWGNPEHDMRVEDGGFSASSGFKLSYPYPHTLRRNFTLQPDILEEGRANVDPEKMANVSFAPNEVQKLTNGFIGDYRAFQMYLEATQGAHFAVHSIMGADMAGQCTDEAPASCVSSRVFGANEPMFFLHHAMVDKIWVDWQHSHTSNLYAFEGGSIQPVTPREFDDYPAGMPPDLKITDRLPTNGLFPEYRIEDIISTTGGDFCYIYE